MLEKSIREIITFLVFVLIFAHCGFSQQEIFWRDGKNNPLTIFVKTFSKLKTTGKLETNCHFNSPVPSPTFSFSFQ